MADINCDFCVCLFDYFLRSLSVLSLGGNLLTEVPDSVGDLQQLQALTLCDNLIEVLPATIARLSNLKSLLLHKNRLRHLPRDIITLKNLVEVSASFNFGNCFRIINSKFCSFLCGKIRWLCDSYRRYHCIHQPYWN